MVWRSKPAPHSMLSLSHEVTVEMPFEANGHASQGGDRTFIRTVVDWRLGGPGLAIAESACSGVGLLKVAFGFIRHSVARILHDVDRGTRRHTCRVLRRQLLQA